MLYFLTAWLVFANAQTIALFGRTSPSRSIATLGALVPTDAASGVLTNATLLWSASNAAACDVSFGVQNPPPTVSFRQSCTLYAPVLALSTTYYWQITVYDARGSAINSAIYSFTTIGTD